MKRRPNIFISITIITLVLFLCITTVGCSILNGMTVASQKLRENLVDYFFSSDEEAEAAKAAEAIA